ncbi:hypothetical protein LEP1GSC166_3289 [Leptospira kirschneri]|nr:hypothetical protein LEP1GSC166_3289 [Leptospira kirschneri]
MKLWEPWTRDRTRKYVSSFVRKGGGLKLNASALTHLVGLLLPLFTKKETKKKYDSFL